MIRALETRLERLKQRIRPKRVCIISRTADGWTTALNGQEKVFQTETAAFACIEQFAETIIFDDI